jgi:hypothetical protein
MKYIIAAISTAWTRACQLLPGRLVEGKPPLPLIQTRNRLSVGDCRGCALCVCVYDEELSRCYKAADALLYGLLGCILLRADVLLLADAVLHKCG